MRLAPLLLGACLVPLPLFAQTSDHAPTALSSASKLEHGKGAAWNYRKPGADFHRYRSVMVDPTTVYSGVDAQFRDIAPADRTKFATFLTQALRAEVTKSPGLATRPGPDVLRIQLTLLGAEKTVGGVATVSHVMPVGLATNAVKSLTGKKGSMTGSVLLAVEVKDAVSGELLAAAVRRESPDALDISATVSTSDTVKAVGNAVAEKLAKRLTKEMHPR